MGMHNGKGIKTCYEWSRKGIEEKKKKSIQYNVLSLIFCTRSFYIKSASVRVDGGVNQWSNWRQ